MPPTPTPELTILDGPVGTQLLARGVPTPPPLWSAHALRVAPETVAAIHRDYAHAGADLLTANTFRTQPGVCSEGWREQTRLAVKLAREAAQTTAARVAGSIAPLADCYRPDLSPGDTPASRAAHRALADELADAGVDILLCETFPHPGEALAALEEAVRTGIEAWLALTPGPQADLLTPAQLAHAARRAADAGARAILVNCAPASHTLPFVQALADTNLPVPIGAYANAGVPDEGMGWRNPAEQPDAPRIYADLAQQWIDAGARIVGSCCGTGPGHIAALRRLVDELRASGRRSDSIDPSSIG